MDKNKISTSFFNVLKALIIPVSLYLVLLILISERVGSWNSIKTMLVLAVVPTITAYGVSFGFVSGIMDFSVGSRMVISGAFAAIGGYYFGIAGMLVAAIVSSIIVSAIMGGLFAFLKIPSLVVSLGMLMVFEIIGVNIVRYSANLSTNLSTGYYISTVQELTFLGTAPYNFVVLAIVGIIFHIVNYRTKFANQARAIGSDELIARSVGIKPMRIKFLTYLVGSIFLGLASMISACYSGAVGYKSDMASMSMVFKPMMAVIIGMSVQSLVPLSFGIFIGAVSLSVIFTGIIALGWSDSLQNVILGLFLLVILGFPAIKKYFVDFKRRVAVHKEFAEKG